MREARHKGRRRGRPLLLVAAVVGASLLLGAALTPGSEDLVGPEPIDVAATPSADGSHSGADDAVAGGRRATREGPEPPQPPPAAGDEQALSARPLLPDLRVLEPSGFYVVDETSSGGDRRLKFTTTIWNAGPGPLEVRGREDPASGELVVYQAFHTPAGDVVPGDQIGTFQFDHRHGHLHLSAFARYELWSLAPDGSLLELVAQNDKVGFCLMDNVPVDEQLIDPSRGVYPTDCRGEVQGISPGYGDVYVAQLYEQDLVIDGVPDGRYALVNVANPDGVIVELDPDDNVAVAYLRISGGQVWAE